MAPTTVYYHFTGKPDLFEDASRRVLGLITAILVATRAVRNPAVLEALGAADSAVSSDHRAARTHTRRKESETALWTTTDPNHPRARPDAHLVE